MKYLPYLVFVIILVITGITIYTPQTDDLTNQVTDNFTLEFTEFPEWNQRQIIRCQANNIAFSYNLRKNPQSALFSNIFTYNFYDTYDYFCIPDDFIMAYNDNKFYRNKIMALKWGVSTDITSDHSTAVISNTHKPDQGFNQSAISTFYELGQYRQTDIDLVPAEISIQHEITCGNQYIPVTINVKNTADEPLRFVYMLFDGAWMTSAHDRSQAGIDQIWPSGEYQFQHIEPIDSLTRDNKQAWFGLYDVNEGGMFAGIFTPPSAHGIRYFFTRDELTYPMPEQPTITNLLSMVDDDNQSVPFNQQEYRIHNTMIDFGVLQPGEERSQIVVKIMFTGLTDSNEIRQKVSEIITTIPEYDLPVYDLDDYNDY